MRRLAAILLAMAAVPLSAATFTVTNTDDSGAGSFRQAILDANGNPGLDTIAFNIPGAGVHTISPVTALPNISDPVTIDGYSQPGTSPNTDPAGFNGTLLIEISGASAGPVNGLPHPKRQSRTDGYLSGEDVLASVAGGMKGLPLGQISANSERRASQGAAECRVCNLIAAYRRDPNLQ